MGEQDSLCANNVSKRLPGNPGELAYTCKTKISIFWLLANEKEEKFASNAKTVY